jgi:hypothetical protein
MTINRTTLLDLPLPVTGTESGVWGDITNNGLSQYLDIAIAGRNALTSSDFTAGALTIDLTEGDASATNIVATSAQYGTLYVSSLAANSTITAPSSNRAYRVVNADATYTLTVKASGQTGVTFPVSTSGVVVFNGTDYVLLGTFAPIFNVDNLRLDGNTISSTDSNGNIVLAPNGTGDVQVDADTLRVGDSNANATVTTNGTGDLILNTNAGTNSGSITIQDAANGNIIFAPNGTGRVQVSGTTSNSGGIELFEDTDNGTNKVLLTVPASIASDVTATIPDTTTTLAGLAVVQTFSVSQRGTVTTDNDGSFDMNVTNNFLCTPTAGFALTFTNITAGQSGNIILVNGSNYAITAAAATKVASTTLATISATGTYWLSYFSPDGTNVYVANTGALA